MKFPIKKFCLIFILIAVLMMSCSLTIGAQTAVNDDDAFFESYTYWNDIIGGNSKQRFICSRYIEHRMF